MLNKAVSHGKLNQNPLCRKNKKTCRGQCEEEGIEPGRIRETRLRTEISFKRNVYSSFLSLHASGGDNQTYMEQCRLGEEGFIRLPAENTKNNLSRVVPIHPFVEECLKQVEKKDGEDRVFLSNGKPINQFSGNFQRQWKDATKKAGLEDFHFHDSRHCSINNLRLAQNDYFRIMAISGHKTMSVFKRYNYVTEGTN